MTAPILANERTAARLLDMKPTEFRALVKDGHLPRPKMLGKLERWPVSELKRIATGAATDGESET
jgi:predicted DNA-binding transcriptional regulator AlpA